MQATEKKPTNQKQVFSPPPISINFYTERSEDRSKVEEFLRNGFKKSFNANTQSFMPLIMETKDNNNRTSACFGIRNIQDSPAFLEHYLEKPIEQCISEVAKQPISRENVVELGSIIGSGKGAGGWLIIAAAAWLQGAGYEWGALTATNDLKKAFSKQGVSLLELADANQTRLPVNEIANWGSYYENEPVVYAIHISTLYEQFSNHPLVMQSMGGLMAYCYNLGQQGIFNGK
ncbi:thermostable hemolysin [Pseudomonas sp. HK3]|jgi:hypothetical protein